MAKRTISGSILLLALCLKYANDWAKMHSDILNKKYIEDEWLDKAVSYDGPKYVTILDSDYPELLKHKTRPPFVVFYEGDLSLLDEKHKRILIRGDNTFGIPDEVLLTFDNENKLHVGSGLTLWVNKTIESQVFLACQLMDALVVTTVLEHPSMETYLAATFACRIYTVATTTKSYNNRLIKEGADLVEDISDIDILD